MLKSIFVTLISLLLVMLFLPAVSVTNWLILVLASAVLTLLQRTLQPLLKLLFLPINIITLGIFSWVIYAVVLWLVTILVPGFTITQLTIAGVTFPHIVSLGILAFIVTTVQNIFNRIV
jgi:putative membrane protein